MCYFTSLGCETLGVILISKGEALATAQYYNNNTSGTGIAGVSDVLLGSALLVTGAVFNVLAWVHINHAGRLMEGNKVTFGGTKNGIGLTFNF